MRTPAIAVAQIALRVALQSDAAIAGDEAERSRMASVLARLLRVLPTALFCLTLAGAADAAAPGAPVVGWGDDSCGQATPP